MQIVIDISEDDYKEVKEETYSGIQKEKTYNGIQIENRAFSAIANGTPLPKGHGKLIEINTIQSMARKKAEDCFPEGRYDYGYRKALFDFAKDIDDAPTIIEADKAESENIDR